jgi:hypothetical protein
MQEMAKLICPLILLFFFLPDLGAFNDDKFQKLKQYVSEHLLDNECKKCLGEFKYSYLSFWFQ